MLVDFVELPSQLFEHFINQPEVLRKHAIHFETKQPIPEELIAQLLKARSFSQGFKTIEYKRAYKFCFNLRYEFKGTTSPHEIKTAIEMQVKMAEQCTACQKKLYLVQKWQRHLLNKMKRSTMIEPAGYKPIRCI